MAEALAVLMAALAGWLVAPPGSGHALPRDLYRDLDSGSRTSTGKSRHDLGRTAASFVEGDGRRMVVCVLACAVTGAVVADVLGLVAGACCGVVLSRALGRLESPGVAREREAVARDLPLAIDLLAACSDVGLPVQAALPHVATAVGGPLRRRFETISSRWALGASSIEVWQQVADDPLLRRLGAAMIRSHRSGAPLAATLERLGGDVRRERRALAQAKARSVGVRVAAPLAVCFLPAFMLIGVVPTVVGGFTHLIG